MYACGFGQPRRGGGGRTLQGLPPPPQQARGPVFHCILIFFTYYFSTYKSGTCRSTSSYLCSYWLSMWVGLFIVNYVKLSLLLRSEGGIVLPYTFGTQQRAFNSPLLSKYNFYVLKSFSLHIFSFSNAPLHMSFCNSQLLFYNFLSFLLTYLPRLLSVQWYYFYICPSSSLLVLPDYSSLTYLTNIQFHQPDMVPFLQRDTLIKQSQYVRWPSQRPIAYVTGYFYLPFREKICWLVGKNPTSYWILFNCVLWWRGFP